MFKSFLVLTLSAEYGFVSRVERGHQSLSRGAGSSRLLTYGCRIKYRASGVRQLNERRLPAVCDAGEGALQVSPWAAFAELAEIG